MVLEGLIEHLGLERVVLSAFGVREGLLLESASPRLRRRDPLVEGCAALGRALRDRRTSGRGAGSLGHRRPSPTLEPIFGERDPVLIAAACRLAELGTQLHPDHRARLIFDQVLRAPLAGVNHPERAFLASAAFARHSASANLPQPEITHRLLSTEERDRARALGRGSAACLRPFRAQREPARSRQAACWIRRPSSSRSAGCGEPSCSASRPRSAPLPWPPPSTASFGSSNGRRPEPAVG